MDYKYVIQSSLQTDKPIMLINSHIGFDAEDGMGIDGAQFQRELLELDRLEKPAIQVWINSPGGVVMDGYNIFNAILKSKTPVDTYNYGIAASIAGVIFMAGRKRVMADYASLMIHSPFGGDDKKQIAAMRDSLVTMLAAKANIAEPEVDFLMDRTSWLNSAECYAKGFCTDIEVTKENNRKRLPVLNEATPIGAVKAAWKESALILNSIFQQNDNNTDMKKVTNRLKLVDGANEDAIVESINAIENRATAAETELVTAKADLKKTKDSLEALQTENQALKDAENAAKEERENAEKAAKAVVLNGILDKAVTVGKIKAEEKAKWIETAGKIGNDEVKDLIEKLPLNKTQAKAVTVEPGNAGDGLKNVAGRTMAAVRDKLGL